MDPSRTQQLALVLQGFVPAARASRLGSLNPPGTPSRTQRPPASPESPGAAILSDPSPVFVAPQEPLWDPPRDPPRALRAARRLQFGLATPAAPIAAGVGNAGGWTDDVGSTTHDTPTPGRAPRVRASQRPPMRRPSPRESPPTKEVTRLRLERGIVAVSAMAAQLQKGAAVPLVLLERAERAVRHANKLDKSSVPEDTWLLRNQLMTIFRASLMHLRAASARE